MENTASNAKQAEYWNGTAGAKWVAMQELMDRQLDGMGTSMLDAAGVNAGERVLDVGCGCGWTTLEAARRAASTGSVTGADLSGPMLEHARQRARDEDLGNVEFVQANVQEHRFDAESYDLVISRFGVMFFDDPVAAFSNMRRALKPGGRLTFVCWRSQKENEWMSMVVKAAAPFIEFPPPPDPEDPGPNSFAEEARVRRILGSAGFSDVTLTKEDQTVPRELGGVDAAVDSRFEIGPLSRLMEEATPKQVEQIRGALRAALEPYYEDGGPTLSWGAWIVTARNG